MQKNPYADDLGERDPYQALGETPRKIADLVGGWTDDQFERTYAPGKWSARKILVHLAQTELALSTRARFALAEPGYKAESFDQDKWLGLDERTDARTALNAYTALRVFNMGMWLRLTDAQKHQSFWHSEYGELNAGWIAAHMAGHDIHHLKHFQQIA
jgi:uncharacterized damage-inducible protein DinB